MSSLYDPAFSEQQEAPPELDFEPLPEETSGLLMLGALRKQIDVSGHKVSIRTLKMGEELEASLLAKKYSETDDAGRGYATAMAAACIESVDGKPLVSDGIGPSESVLERRYRYLLDNWYWTSIRVVWQEYLDLVEEVNKSLDEIKKD